MFVVGVLCVCVVCVCVGVWFVLFVFCFVCVCCRRSSCFVVAAGVVVDAVLGDKHRMVKHTRTRYI